MTTSIMHKRRPFGGGAMDLYSREDDRYFQRVVAGIGWPSEKPGAVVVLGEELTVSPGTMPNIHWLGEYETGDLGALLRQAVLYMHDLKVMAFYAGMDQPARSYLLHFNREARDQRKPTLDVLTPPNLVPDGGISYHVNVLKDLLRPESKRLTLSSKSRLPGALGELPESIGALKEGDCPLVAALAYAVISLKSQPHHSMELSGNRDLCRCKTEYDLFA